MQDSSSLGRVIIILSLLCVPSSVGIKDIYLIGLMPFEGGWKGGLALLTASELALEHINEQQDVLAGYRLKLLWNDTKCDAGTGLDVMYQHFYTPPTKMMVVGAACSPVSEATAQVSFRWNLVQISHLSSSPSLSNRDRFKRFFRIISPAMHVNPPRIDMFKYFKWTKISTVHQAMELFSEPIYNMFSLMKEAGINIVRSEIITTSDVSQQVLHLKENGARIILGDFYENIARKVFCEAYKINFYGPQIVWILNGWYSQTWWSTKDSTISCSPDQILAVINGYIAVDRLWVNSKPDVTISGYTPHQIQAVYLNRSANRVTAGLQQGLMGYDAMWAAALAINKTIGDLLNLGGTKKIEDFTYKDEMMGELLLNNTKKTDFYGTSGHLKFDEKGDPSSRFTIDVFKDGVRTVVGLYDPDLSTDIKIEWTTDDVAAALWEDGRVPKDSVMLILRTETLSLTLYILVCCVAGLGALLTCFFLAFSFVFRGRRIVKMSSPRLNVMTLIGCLLLYGTVFAESTSTFTDVVICQVKAVFLTVGFSLTFGALFAKTWRVYRIFTAGAKQKTNIKDLKLIVLVCSLAAVNMIAITVWFVVDPMEVISYDLEPEVNVEADIEIRSKVLKCQSPNQLYFLSTLFAIQGVLLLLGTFLALQTRNVKVEGLNDSKMIGVSIYNVIVLSILGVITSLTLKYKVNLNYGITSFIVITGTTITQCLIVVPKITAYWNSRYTVEDQNHRTQSAITTTASRTMTNDENKTPIISVQQLQNTT